MKQVILLAFILAFSSAKYLPLLGVDAEYSSVTLKVDHFNASDARTFQCRYSLDTSDYDPSTGVVFMNMGGEGGMMATSPDQKLQDRSALKDISRTFKAANLYIEHRYYGESLPVSDLSFDNLQLLTVEQALADVYELIQYAQDQGLVQKSSPIITIGGSYSGAMSAWFRHAYSNITVGSWASGAVINGIIDNWQMDHQVYLSTMKSGAECPANIQKVTEYVEESLKDPSLNSYLKNTFQATFLTDNEFLFMLADTFLETVQYGSRSELCNAFTSMDNLKQQCAIIAQQFSTGSDSLTFYSAKSVANIQQSSGMDRPWWFEKCNEIAYMQTYNPNTTISMRSQKIDLQFYKDFCQEAFGHPVFPDGSFNEKFGGADIVATNIFFGDGNEDPWKQDMILSPSGSLYLCIVPGTDAGHCQDMSSSTCINRFTSYAKGWISEHYQKMSFLQ